ncbi:cupin-like domain-containing protein [Gilvimarinus xylanilyticus]|uniref:Cupin-like domain-containing protein n=1 Tax=Gilvimarinus xylanilyticus TaxID=2944139 RepID=A0A9X2HUC7_9GAMM|nr:cupin-like domain-containing protein [Gilvimarinus xylanilyticus]MCP8897799.1 cupin-like domain-containing protein [Gilvimarinus xylanilyticus]
MQNFLSFPEYRGVSREQFFNDIVPQQKPVVIRGLVGDWPLVEAALQSDEYFCRYLAQFYRGEHVNVVLGHPAIEGRFFYNDNLDGFNYIEGGERLDLFLGRLLELAGRDVKPSVAVQGMAVDKILPGLSAANPAALFAEPVAPKLWVGNKVSVSAHYDGSDNLACVVAGKRRFVLFPPEQVANLYPGPLDYTPAGAPVSLVSLHDPDFDRYPRYREALKNAYSAVLEPGDAIFIPMLWWHHVDSLAEVNGLMNYWWNGSIGKPQQKPTPLQSLNFAAMAMRDLTPAQRNAWRAMFDHYLFKQGEDPQSYIPTHKQGVLGEMSPEFERQVKDWFIRLLK